jgi:hypothetical protein
MSLILSGTDGLSDIDGSAATPAIRGTDANTGIFFPAADTIAFAEGGAEVARFDSSGQLGIGTTTPDALLHAYKTSGKVATFGNNVNNNGNYIVLGGTVSNKNWVLANNMIVGGEFGVGRTSANGGTTIGSAYDLMINSSGQLILGDTTADGRLKVVETAAGAGVTFYNSANNSAGQIGTTNEAGVANSLEINAYRGSGRIVFKTNNTYAASFDSSGRLLLGTTTVGTDGPRITVANSNNTQTWQLGTIAAFTPFYVYNNSTVGVYITNGGTSWSSSSDERIKDIIEPIENAITKVSALRAVIGKYKTDEEGTRRSFLIAQDVQAVFPEAINVQEDEQGTLGLQYTEIIPLLVAAIKEQSALITTLTARIAALESA